MKRMEIKKSIFGVKIDFNQNNEIVFNFLVEDDGSWYVQEDEINASLIGQIISVLQKVSSHLAAGRKSMKVFRELDVTAELRDANLKANKHARIVYLFASPISNEVIRFSDQWNSDVLEMMKQAQEYCKSLGMSFEAPNFQPSSDPA
jgi:hypothetical protein